MTLKLLIFAVIAVMIYRFLGGKIPLIDTKEKNEKDPDDVLKECAICGVYAISKDGIAKKGTFYCSIECSKSDT